MSGENINQTSANAVFWEQVHNVNAGLTTREAAELLSIDPEVRAKYYWAQSAPCPEVGSDARLLFGGRIAQSYALLPEQCEAVFRRWDLEAESADLHG